MGKQTGRGKNIMNDGYWKDVPRDCYEEWSNIFVNDREGSDLSASCPVCHKKGLHRYYNAHKKMKMEIGSEQYIGRGGVWNWCSFCRSYEHGQAWVPDWWVPGVEVDGDKLTAIPSVLDMAYQDAHRVNKWKSVPEQYNELWNEIFSKNQGEVVLKEDCPICNEKRLFQYYELSRPEQVKYKKKLYKGQGYHWEWCASCFHYKFDYSIYVPLDWDYELDIESWKLMVIPEYINEKIICV